MNKYHSGKEMPVYSYHTCNSPVGKLTIASCGDVIVGLWIENQRYFMDVLQGKTCREEKTEAIRCAMDWLDRYFAGENPPADDLPITFIGSDFRREVWQILREIPYGKVITYGDIAGRIAARRGIGMMSARAVGGAVGHNPISIIVPCHRVVGAGGKLTGYSGGVGIKAKLLALEGADVSIS